MYEVNDILEMENEFNGVLDIVEIWFKNYKGQSLLKSKGYRGKAEAISIINQAIGQSKAQ